MVRGAIACAMLLSLAACSLPEAQPDLTRFYLLTPAGGSGDASASGRAAETRRVWLKRVEVPEFLRGKIMQVRLAANEVKFIDTARWAEPLEAGLARVVRENLGRAEGIEVVERVADERDLEVVVHLRHCEGVLPAGVARLAARVEILSAGVTPRKLAEEEFATEVPGWDRDDYGDLAAKLSEAAATLSARIAAMVSDADTGGE